MSLKFSCRCGQHLKAREASAGRLTQCPRCGDSLRVLAFITHPDTTAHILEHLGLATPIPPVAPARAPPGHACELDLDA